MANKKVSYTKLKTLLKAIRAGLAKVNLSSITVLNKAYATMADLDKDLATYQALFDNADNLRQQADAAEQQVQAQAPTIAQFVSALVKAFKAALGNTSPTLQTLGITPDKVPAPLTVEQKAEKVAKNLATRGARHTMSEKAKSKIHGQVAPTATPPAAAAPVVTSTAGTTPTGTPPAGH